MTVRTRNATADGAQTIAKAARKAQRNLKTPSDAQAGIADP